MSKGNPNWKPGGPSPNPGGRSKKLVEIEAMIDKNHRNVDVMREVFERLKALALGEIVHVVDKDGEVDVSIHADPAFMKMYLERVLGPVKDWKIDLTGASDETVEWLAKELLQ